AGAVPDVPEIPPLASHVAERVDRQELRDPLPVGRQAVRHLLLPRGRVAGHLRLGQRADTSRVLGPDLLSVHPQEGGVALARSPGTSAERPWAASRPGWSPAPDPRPSWP